MLARKCRLIFWVMKNVFLPGGDPGIVGLYDCILDFDGLDTTLDSYPGDVVGIRTRYLGLCFRRGAILDRPNRS